MAVHILLLTLKIIGFVLLGILALILLILIIPFKYRITGFKDDETYLVKAYLFCFKLFDSSKKKVKKEKPKPKEEQKEEKEEEESEKKSIFSKIKDNKDLLLSDETKALIEKTILEVKHLLKHLLPRKISGYIDYSLGSPENTGYVMALAGMIRPDILTKVRISPDFENDSYVRLNLKAKGHFVLIYILIIALRILLNKQTRQLISCLKREA
ncbi:MAG: hypothetical protein J5811_07015 [Lachnospiraceae bacterium]|nr:hypothetical protein [Lachnospiraceae bacterium]